MKTHQPSYHCIENIGDVNPFTHGGAFVCVDKFNLYSPILLILDTYPDHIEFTHRLLEFTLDRCFFVKKENKLIGVGSNHYHTNSCEWFGDMKGLLDVANFIGAPNLHSLAEGFCSSDPVARAFSYKAVLDYYGAHEFDQYPRELTEEKAQLFCDKMFEQMQETKQWHQGYFAKEVS